MNYKDYCNQPPDAILRFPQVFMTPEDVYNIQQINTSVNPGAVVTIEFPNRYGGGTDYYSYFVPRGEAQFWTMDEHGNKDRRTVFQWLEIPQA